MKLKKEYFLLAGVIVALVLYVSLRKTGRTNYELPDLKSIKASDITSLSIKTPKNDIELKKESGKWLIYPKKYPADDSKIEPMIDTVRDLKVTALVSDSKSYQRYDLGPEKCIHVRAGSGNKTLRTFDIGKIAPLSHHTFVKFPDDPSVYHARGNFRDRFDTNVDDLRDKTVLAFETENIRQFEITRDGKTRRFVQKAAQAPSDAASNDQKKPEDQKGTAEKAAPAAKMIWTDDTGASVDEPAVRDLLDSTARLKCREFIKDKTKADFTGPVYALKLQAGEDKVMSLSIFAKQDKGAAGYPAVSSGSDYPFLLTSGKAEAVLKLFQPASETKEKKEKGDK